MKKIILILTTITLGVFLMAGFSYSEKSMRKGFPSENVKKENKDNNSGLFHLNIHSKNNAGWFHFTVLNTKDNTNPPAAPSDITGFFQINSETVFPIILPNNELNELTPTFTVFREMDPKIGKIAPTRGFWTIDFDISCIGKDLVERRITPRYQIQAKNYFDELTKDGNGNDGFKIYLIKNFELKDTAAMLNKNNIEYNAFKTRTGRP